jgi:hypothetical protein
MNVEQLVERILAGEIGVLGDHPPQYYFVHHKSHMIYTGTELGPPPLEPSNQPHEL